MSSNKPTVLRNNSEASETFLIVIKIERFYALVYTSTKKSSIIAWLTINCDKRMMIVIIAQWLSLWHDIIAIV